jgi:UDP-N-acetylmuramyl pentapeptide phosphotransferase/UDP-N-acetylglucosamine-1-phosphate transferase
MWGDIAIAFTIALVTSFMATPFTIRLAKKLRSGRYAKRSKTYK